MDFYAIKFLASSSLTGETYFGYIFGKKRQTPEFNVSILNRKTIKEYEIPDISEEYINFKSKMDILNYTLLKDSKTMNLNKQFNAYFFTTIKKYGLDTISTKFHLAVEEGDPYVLKAIVQDILFDWANETSIKLVAQKYRYEDLTWLSATKEKGEEGVFEYLKREDVIKALEVYPVIDPLEGILVYKLDVGDPLFVIEMSKNGNKEIIEGNLISKELIPNTDYIFLKIDLGNGIYGKTVVLKSLKININETKLMSLRKQQDKYYEKNDKMDIIGDLDVSNSKKVNDFSNKMSSMDIILIASFSVIGILVIILIAIWLGAF